MTVVSDAQLKALISFCSTDIHTLLSLVNNEDSSAHIFIGLNNAADLASQLNLSLSRVHELDWWDERIVKVSLPSDIGNVQAQVRLTCTPSQHTSGRQLFSDRWHSLWASWAVEQLLPPTSQAFSDSTDKVWEKVGKKVYFAGDTGYRTVHKGEDEDTVPVCPVFLEIGQRFGGFDVGIIPIGYVFLSS